MFFSLPSHSPTQVLELFTFPFLFINKKRILFFSVKDKIIPVSLDHKKLLLWSSLALHPPKKLLIVVNVPCLYFFFF